MNYEKWYDNKKIKNSSILYERLLNKYTGKNLLNEVFKLQNIADVFTAAKSANKDAKTIAGELATLTDAPEGVKKFVRLLNGLSDATKIASRLADFEKAAVKAAGFDELVQNNWYKNLENATGNINPLEQLNRAIKGKVTQPSDPTPAPTTTPPGPSKIGAAAEEGAAEAVRGAFSGLSEFFRNLPAGKEKTLGGRILRTALYSSAGSIVGYLTYQEFWNNAVRDYENNNCIGILKNTQDGLEEASSDYKKCATLLTAVSVKNDEKAVRLVLQTKKVLKNNPKRLKDLLGDDTVVPAGGGGTPAAGGGGTPAAGGGGSKTPVYVQGKGWVYP